MSTTTTTFGHNVLILSGRKSLPRQVLEIFFKGARFICLVFVQSRSVLLWKRNVDDLYQCHFLRRTFAFLVMFIFGSWRNFERSSCSLCTVQRNLFRWKRATATSSQQRDFVRRMSQTLMRPKAVNQTDNNFTSGFFKKAINTWFVSTVCCTLVTSTAS